MNSATKLQGGATEVPTVGSDKDSIRVLGQKTSEALIFARDQANLSVKAADGNRPTKQGHESGVTPHGHWKKVLPRVQMTTALRSLHSGVLEHAKQWNVKREDPLETENPWIFTGSGVDTVDYGDYSLDQTVDSTIADLSTACTAGVAVDLILDYLREIGTSRTKAMKLLRIVNTDSSHPEWERADGRRVKYAITKARHNTVYYNRPYWVNGQWTGILAALHNEGKHLTLSDAHKSGYISETGYNIHVVTPDRPRPHFGPEPTEFVPWTSYDPSLDAPELSHTVALRRTKQTNNAPGFHPGMIGLNNSDHLSTTLFPSIIGSADSNLESHILSFIDSDQTLSSVLDKLAQLGLDTDKLIRFGVYETLSKKTDLNNATTDTSKQVYYNGNGKRRVYVRTGSKEHAVFRVSCELPQHQTPDGIRLGHIMVAVDSSTPGVLDCITPAWIDLKSHEVFGFQDNALLLQRVIGSTSIRYSPTAWSRTVDAWLGTKRTHEGRKGQRRVKVETTTPHYLADLNRMLILSTGIERVKELYAEYNLLSRSDFSYASEIQQHRLQLVTSWENKIKEFIENLPALNFYGYTRVNPESSEIRKTIAFATRLSYIGGNSS